MSMTYAHPTVWVDHTRFGITNRFTYKTPVDMISRLAVGELVWVTDDDVEPYLCRVIALLNEGRSIRYERVKHADI
jgi:hypothetical protein